MGFKTGFTSPFSKTKLEKHVEGLTPSEYSDFLIGRTNYTHDLAKINYQDVAIEINDFLISATVSSKIKEISQQSKSIIPSITSAELSIFVWRFLKCFTFNIPYEKDAIISQILIELNRTIFPNKSRPMNGWGEDFGISLYYHLPNQLFKSYPTRKIMWPSETSKSYSIFSYIANIEILQLRKITEDTCIDVENYDEWFKNQVVSSVGCYPPYWNITLKIPMCNTKEKLIDFSEKLWDSFYGKIEMASPCRTIQGIDVEYLDSQKYDEGSENSLYIPMFFRDTLYKRVKQVRAYSLHDLTGDIGGYVGLLLGYAIVQIPNFLRNCISFIASKERTCGMLTTGRVISSNEDNHYHKKEKVASIADTQIV